LHDFDTDAKRASAAPGFDLAGFLRAAELLHRGLLCAFSLNFVLKL
jgi:hypothetical protein